MKSGARLGLAVTAGYLLGRFHKMKWALALAAWAGRGQLPSGTGGLIQQGAKVLASSPEITKLTEEMRGRLIDAGKAAAVTAVSNKIDSLSEGLRERSDAMRAASAAGVGAAARDRDEEERYRDEGRRRDEEERYRDEGRRRDEEERYRDEGRRRDEEERYREEVPRPRRRSDEGEGGRGPAVRRRPASRSGSDRTRASGQSRSSDGDDARTSARQGQEGGLSRPRSSALQTEGDSE
jgi:hypothetical protein